MSDLQTTPLWRPEDLGRPVPADPHAVSVCLPTWADCVGYEEGDERVVNALKAGYPRFVLHPDVQRLHQHANATVGHPGHSCLVLHSERAAWRCAGYVGERSGGPEPAVVPLSAAHQAWAVVVPEAQLKVAREYWQHTGEGVSSRCAAAILAELADDRAAACGALTELRGRLAEWYGCPADHVFVHANGMAAMAAVMRTLIRLRPRRRTAQLGFPYVDVFKVQERVGAGGVLIKGTGPDSVAELARLIAAEELAGCVVETPGNPLLTCVDLPAAAEVLRPAGVPLVVDDTVAGVGNIDVSPWADLIFCSLTKLITGSGMVMGGAVIVPPASPQAGRLRAVLAEDYEPTVWWQDALLLAAQSRGYQERCARINGAAAELAERLAAHPLVKRVLYPSRTDVRAFDRIRRPQGGYGCLLSLELEEPERRTVPFYDALAITKGPSLGTTYSLACPFTILAHYDELDWAESCGVSRWLVRLSVGLEPVEELWARLAAALAASALGDPA